MAMSRYPLLIICLFSLFTISGCIISENGTLGGWNTTTTPNPDISVTSNNEFEKLPPIQVAILLPLSGSKSALGQSMLQAAQLALFDIGYTNFNLVPQDTKGSSSGAASAAKKAIDNGAQLILGPLFSNSVRAVQKIAAPRNINVIAFSTDSTLANTSTFIMGFMPTAQVDRITQYALQNGYEDFAIIAPKDRYGDIVTQRFQQQLDKQNGRVSKSLRFNPGDPTIINQIASLKETNLKTKAVFMPVGGSQIETISSALSYNRLMPNQVKRIGTGLWDDRRVAQLPNMQGAWFAGPAPKSRLNFEKSYLDAYGQKPVRLATLAYDATALASILALNGFKNKSGNIFNRQAITNPNGFSGTDGVFRFHNNGMIERALAILELRDGRIIEIDPAADRF